MAACKKVFAVPQRKEANKNKGKLFASTEKINAPKATANIPNEVAIVFLYPILLIRIPAG